MGDPAAFGTGIRRLGDSARPPQRVDGRRPDHAVIGLTRSTAFFYAGTGIRCNSVAPGATMTNIQAEFRSAFAGERMGPYLQTNVPQPATAEELAAAIAWLLSDDSANVNGAVLPSDNGWSVI